MSTVIVNTFLPDPQVKHLTWATVGMALFTIVLLGAIGGLIAGIVIASQDSKSTPVCTIRSVKDGCPFLAFTCKTKKIPVTINSFQRERRK